MPAWRGCDPVPTPGRRVQRPTAKSLRPGLESSAHHAGEGHSGGSASSTSAAERHNRRSDHAKLTLHGPCIDRADETAGNARTCRRVAQLGSSFCPTLAQLLHNRRPRCYPVAGELLSALTRPSSKVTGPTARGWLVNNDSDTTPPCS